jgi:hypothetical protein
MRSQKASRWPARIQASLYAAAAALILLLGVISLQMPSSPETQAVAVTSEPLSDPDALWYLNRKETSSELDELELELALYANLL